MSLIYHEEHLQLQDSARDVLSGRAGARQQRRLRDEVVAGGFDATLWQDMLNLGWSALAAPSGLGGLEFGFKGFAPLFVEIGRHLGASPLLSSVVICAGLIECVGDAVQQQALVPALIGGERRFALACEEQPRHGGGEISTRAHAVTDGVVLDGRKCWVLDGVGADGFLTVARLDDATPALFLVPSDATGVAIIPLQMIDSRNHAELVLDKVQLPGSARIGGEKSIQDALDLALDRARACLAAELLGLSGAMFEMTIDYLKTRVQFDAPIGSFQALQHRAARMHVDLELARSAVMAAFEVLEEKTVDPRQRARLISLGKWKANETAQRISNEAVQMHGGIGVTDEFDLGLFLKRTRVAQACLGDSDWLCARYAASFD